MSREGVRRIERELAYEAARSDIECLCTAHQHSGPQFGLWFDLSSAKDYDVATVERAVKYLESRKLLIRDDATGWVKVKVPQ